MDPAFDPFVTDELKADPVAWPILEKMPEKSVTDVLKGYAHSQHRLGSAVPLLKGDAKPEDIAAWRKEHLPKLENAKLVDAPIKPPEKYEVKLPEGVPAEAWSEADSELAQGYAKKHGLSQEALNDGLAIVSSVLGKYGASVQVNREQSIAKTKEWADKEGVSIEQVNAALERFNNDPRSGWDDATKEAVSKSGHADNPLVVQAIYKLMKDSGTFDVRNDGGAEGGAGAGGGDAETAYNEARAIKFDDKHPMHATYMNEGGNGPLNDRVDAAYKKRFGSKEE